MSMSIFTLAALAAIPIHVLAAATPAKAETGYPFCTTPTWSEALNCAYQTREQCAAINAGMPTTCVANPGYTGAQADISRATVKRAR